MLQLVTAFRSQTKSRNLKETLKQLLTLHKNLVLNSMSNSSHCPFVILQINIRLYDIFLLRAGQAYSASGHPETALKRII